MTYQVCSFGGHNKICPLETLSGSLSPVQEDKNANLVTVALTPKTVALCYNSRFTHNPIGRQLELGSACGRCLTWTFLCSILGLQPMRGSALGAGCHRGVSWLSATPTLILQGARLASSCTGLRALLLLYGQGRNCMALRARFWVSPSGTSAACCWSEQVTRLALVRGLRKYGPPLDKGTAKLHC